MHKKILYAWPEIKKQLSKYEIAHVDLSVGQGNESKLDALRKMLNDGENSGVSQYSFDSFIAEIDRPARPIHY